MVAHLTFSPDRVGHVPWHGEAAERAPARCSSRPSGECWRSARHCTRAASPQPPGLGAGAAVGLHKGSAPSQGLPPPALPGSCTVLPRPATHGGPGCALQRAAAHLRPRRNSPAHPGPASGAQPGPGNAPLVPSAAPPGLPSHGLPPPGPAQGPGSGLDPGPPRSRLRRRRAAHGPGAPRSRTRSPARCPPDRPRPTPAQQRARVTWCQQDETGACTASSHPAVTQYKDYLLVLHTVHMHVTRTW